ncbi:MAG TPA: hypothetical protein VHI13_13520 [Candidatus Kapabacteria bacterium]|nr:hypothetical protein [Candidatus Kapabacteria bacterium]
MRAQPPDTIVANPKAQVLRRIWSIAGNQAGGDQVGTGIGSVSDVNGDGIDDFAVCFGTAGEWRVYYGGRDSIRHTPAWIAPQTGAVPPHPVVGDFWGTGHKAVGFGHGDYTLRIFRTDSGHFSEAPVILDPGTMTPFTHIFPEDILGADLDGDGADELIIYSAGVSRAGDGSRYPEVWIYRGGPNFQVDTPTVILKDTESNDGGGYSAIVPGRWDSDAYVDLLTLRRYPGGTYRTKFWFGSPGSPWNWHGPDRVAEFGGFDVVALDCDGDSVLDLVAPPRASIPWRVPVYLSGNGKSIRTRTLAADDADMTLYRTGYDTPARLGYVGDSARRYEMLAIFGTGGPTFLGFNGSPVGPDHQYDVYSNDLNFALLEPLGDVTGDGWNDLIASYPDENFNAGVAVVYAGGPYIPRDSAAGVETIAVAGVHDAVSVWPNPARDEVHIAWRGDLSHMPATIAVYDLSGREVAHGNAEPARGEAFWHCAEVPGGVYLLCLYDAQRHPIATVRLTKQ